LQNWFLGHFFKLGQHRQYGMAANPLLVSEIYAYADRVAPKGWSHYFFYVISELDGEFLKLKAEDAERERKSKEVDKPVKKP